MDTLRGHIKRIPELLAPKIDGIKTNFDEWKVPWTAGRASKLDNLDAKVSTRAPANTALSSDVWTNTRASKLDNLDAKVSTRATQASVDAVLQKQKVIRGVARLSTKGQTTDILDGTINLPQTINPDYANVSVDITAPDSYQRVRVAVVTHVTSTTIGIKYNAHSTGSTDNAYVGWQVVGGID